MTERCCDVKGVTATLFSCQVIRKMGHYLKMNLSVPEDYVEGFVRANNTFLHQLVFDPVSREAVPLNPYPAHLDVKSLSYAGLYPPQTLSHLLITILEKKKSLEVGVLSWMNFGRFNLHV